MISARNQIDATIAEVKRGAVNAAVLLRTAQGTELYASITNAGADEMQLKSGDKVIAFCKASHVLVATGWAMAISARNKLEGVAETISMGAVNAEVVIRVTGGDRLKAVITNEAVRDLALKEGDKVFAIIKASDMMLAK